MSKSQEAMTMDDGFERIIRTDIGSDGIAVGTIDQDGRAANVIDQAMLDALDAFVERVLTDDAIRGAIITSGKATFVAGADLKGIEESLRQTGKTDPETQFEQSFSLSRILRRLESGGTPFACALNGIAVGGGLEIALACHFCVAADDPRLVVGLPEVQVGLLPGGGGTQRMLRLAGIFQAMPLLLEGKSFPVSKAMQLGLIHAAAPRDELVARAKDWLLDSPDPVAPWDRDGYSVPGGTPADNPQVAQALAGSRQRLLARTHGLYPAPLAILSCIENGSVLPIDAGLELECKHFVALNNDPTAVAMMRTLFVSKTRADKLDGRPREPGRRPVNKLGLIGAGSMGAGIALLAAQKKLDVTIVDRDMDAANNALRYAEKKMGRLVEKGRMTVDQADSVYARIQPSDAMTDLAGCDLVVEAVFEDRDVKADVTKRAAEVLDDDAVLATNTSGLPITGLGKAYARPERFIGLHFFSPADRMPLVEVIRGEQTSDETLAWALDFIQQLGKTPIIVNDSRGFYTSRFIGSFIEEGIGMIAEGVEPALVEECAVKLGMPLGPLSISDEIGLDLSAQSGKQMQADLGDAYEPGRAFPVISALVDAGRHGRKNGRGFFDYAGDGSKTVWSGLADLYPPLAEPPSVDDVRDRLLYAQLIEGLKCLQEGVLTTPTDGDLGAVLGVGFPTWTGGPFSYFDRVGGSEFVAECDRLSAYGEHLAAPQLARTMAASGARFYA